jgi:hypothetical protein
MKTANLGAPPSAPGAFTVSPTAENYWQELAAYCYVITMWNKSQAGMQICQAEASDYASLQADVQAYKTDLIAWLHDLPSAPDDTDPNVRGLPETVLPAVWESIGSRVVSLAVAGAAGGIPGLLLDIGIEILVEIFSEWLAGRVFPSGEGSTAELVKVLRKALLHDPGLLDLERSVFVAEKDNWLGLGDKVPIGQYLFELLTDDEEDSVFWTPEKQSVLRRLASAFFTGDYPDLQSVFAGLDAGDNVQSICQTLLTGLIDSATDAGETVNYSLLRRLLEGFLLEIDVDGTPVKASCQGLVESP